MYMRPMYCPMMLRIAMIIPPKNRIRQMVDAYPGVSLPITMVLMIAGM